jgi:hypothetical protein
LFGNPAFFEMLNQTVDAKSAGIEAGSPTPAPTAVPKKSRSPSAFSFTELMPVVK